MDQHCRININLGQSDSEPVPWVGKSVARRMVVDFDGNSPRHTDVENDEGHDMIMELWSLAIALRLDMDFQELCHLAPMPTF